MARLLDVFLLKRVFRTTTLIFFFRLRQHLCKNGWPPKPSGPKPRCSTNQPSWPRVVAREMLQRYLCRYDVRRWKIPVKTGTFFVAEIQSLSLTLFKTGIWTPTECLRHAFWTEVPGSVHELPNLWFWHRRGWWQQRLIGYKRMMASMRYKWYKYVHLTSREGEHHKMKQRNLGRKAMQRIHLRWKWEMDARIPS